MPDNNTQQVVTGNSFVYDMDALKVGISEAEFEQLRLASEADPYAPNDDEGPISDENTLGDPLAAVSAYNQVAAIAGMSEAIFGLMTSAFRTNSRVRENALRELFSEVLGRKTIDENVVMDARYVGTMLRECLTHLSVDRSTMRALAQENANMKKQVEEARTEASAAKRELAGLQSRIKAVEDAEEKIARLVRDSEMLRASAKAAAGQQAILRAVEKSSDFNRAVIHVKGKGFVQFTGDNSSEDNCQVAFTDNVRRATYFRSSSIAKMMVQDKRSIVHLKLRSLMSADIIEESQKVVSGDSSNVEADHMVHFYKWEVSFPEIRPLDLETGCVFEATIEDKARLAKARAQSAKAANKSITNDIRDEDQDAVVPGTSSKKKKAKATKPVTRKERLHAEAEAIFKKPADEEDDDEIIEKKATKAVGKKKNRVKSTVKSSIRAEDWI